MSGVAMVRRKPWGEAVATFFTCLALGPPIGGIVFAVSVPLMPALAGVGQAGGEGDVAGQIATALFVGLFAIPFSYLVGGLQAAATGMSFLLFGWFRGKPPLWFAAITAAAVYAGSMLAGMADAREIVVPMLLVHAVSTLFCWLIVRTYWQRLAT